MYYKLFLDTNIYDGANYSFHNTAFKQIRNMASENTLSLIINSVVEGEVRAHIARDIKKAAKELNKFIEQREFAAFRKLDGYAQILEKKNPDEWVQSCIKEFDSLLNDCKTKRISIDGVGVEQIMSDYFQKKPPFEEQKPDEFKDAIAVASLLRDVHTTLEERSAAQNAYIDELQYCIVSNDKGFRAAVTAGLSESEKENVRLFASLNEFVQYTVLMDRQAEFLKAFLESEAAIDEMEETVKEAVYNADVMVYPEGGEYVDDQEILDVEDITYELCILGIFQEEDAPTTAKVSIKAKCVVNVWYKFIDENNSYWDKEDNAYLWITTGEIEGTYDVEFETVISIDISECQVPEKWQPGDQYDFEDESIEFIDYVDAPERIELSEDNLISEEVLEKTEPFCDEDDEYVRDKATDVCPDCGTPIGLRNDGGNGFCINCALNH